MKVERKRLFIDRFQIETALITRKFFRVLAITVSEAKCAQVVLELVLEGVVAQWCNPLILQPEPSGGVGSKPGRASPLERHDKGSRTRLALSYFCDPSAWR